MNPTDHAAKRARVREIALKHFGESCKDLADALACEFVPELDATPVYPSVELDHRAYATWDGHHWIVTHGEICGLWSSAADVASKFVSDVTTKDTIVMRLLALKGGAASVEPFGWSNRYDSGWGVIHRTEEAARLQGIDHRFGALEIAVPLYRHPPTPVAYQKIGACVTAGDGYMTWTYGTRQVANAREWAAQHGGAAHVLYAGEALT